MPFCRDPAGPLQQPPADFALPASTFADRGAKSGPSAVGRFPPSRAADRLQPQRTRCSSPPPSFASSAQLQRGITGARQPLAATRAHKFKQRRGGQRRPGLSAALLDFSGSISSFTPYRATSGGPFPSAPRPLGCVLSQFRATPSFLDRHQSPKARVIQGRPWGGAPNLKIPHYSAAQSSDHWAHGSSLPSPSLLLGGAIH